MSFDSNCVWGPSAASTGFVFKLYIYCQCLFLYPIIELDQIQWVPISFPVFFSFLILILTVYSIKVRFFGVFIIWPWCTPTLRGRHKTIFLNRAGDEFWHLSYNGKPETLGTKVFYHGKKFMNYFYGFCNFVKG